MEEVEVVAIRGGPPEFVDLLLFGASSFRVLRHDLLCGFSPFVEPFPIGGSASLAFLDPKRWFARQLGKSRKNSTPFVADELAIVQLETENYVRAVASFFIGIVT